MPSHSETVLASLHPSTVVQSWGCIALLRVDVTLDSGVFSHVAVVHWVLCKQNTLAMGSHRRGMLLSGTSSQRLRPPRDPPSHRLSRPRAPPTTRRGQRACLRLRTTLTCPSLAKTPCGALHRIALLVQSALSLLKQVRSSAASFGVA